MLRKRSVVSPSGTAVYLDAEACDEGFAYVVKRYPSLLRALRPGDWLALPPFEESNFSAMASALDIVPRGVLFVVNDLGSADLAAAHGRTTHAGRAFSRLILQGAEGYWEGVRAVYPNLAGFVVDAETLGYHPAAVDGARERGWRVVRLADESVVAPSFICRFKAQHEPCSFQCAGRHPMSFRGEPMEMRGKTIFSVSSAGLPPAHPSDFLVLPEESR